jgi:hypothetical protein
MPTTPTATGSLAEIAPALAGLLAKTTAELRRHALSAAVRLARAGRYADAEQRLAETASQSEPDARALDLLARIRVRQGRLAEAEALWQQAAKLSPEDAGVAEALAAVRALQARRVAGWWWRAWPAVLALTVVGGGLWWVRVLTLANAEAVAVQERQTIKWQREWQQTREAGRLQSESAARAQQALLAEIKRMGEQVTVLAGVQTAGQESMRRTEAQLAELAKSPALVADLTRQLAEQKLAGQQSARDAAQRHVTAQAEWRDEAAKNGREIARLVSLVTPPAATVSPAPTELAGLSGWKSAQRGSALVVWSPEGIFVRGLPLVRGKGEEALRELGLALHRAGPSALRVEVLGVAAEGALFGRAETLAYRRAAVVAERLAAISGIPSASVVARAATRAEIAEQAGRANGQVEAESVIIEIRFGATARR